LHCNIAGLVMPGDVAMQDLTPLRTLAASGALAAGLLCLAPGLSAHDIPADVHVHVFVKPEGQRLRLLVRVPLGAMRDIVFPLREPGFLELARADAALQDAARLWVAGGIGVYEDDAFVGPPSVVSTRVSLPSDRSFQTYDDALAHVMGPPLAPDTGLIWNQALLDVLLEYPIASDRSRFSIEPDFARLGLRVVTVVRFLPPGGAVRAFELTGDPGRVRLDPRWHQAAIRFVVLGFEHILSGWDHLLFLVCLVVPYRRLRALVLTVTAFTVAHSVTLIGSAYNMAPDALWFPPLVETLIAMSIVYMALENVVLGAQGTLEAASGSRRWAITFAFGLVHGFGFSFALRETMQFAGSHLLTSLVAFNVGIELGQILVLLALVPALNWLFRAGVAERIGVIIISALVAHTAWHWMTARWTALAAFWPPAIDPKSAATALRWLIAMLVVGAGVRWVSRRWGSIRR
jgi:hypothetical protein